MVRTSASFLLLFFLAYSQGFTQINVRKAIPDAQMTTAQGFFYSLPRTGIKVEVIVKKTQKVKGPFAEFADKYLGLTQVINVNSTEYELSALKLSSFAEPDPKEYYFVEMTGRKKDQKAYELFLSGKGGLIGMQNYQESVSENSKSYKLDGCIPGVPELPNPTMFERVDTVIRRISVDTTTIEQKVFKKISSAKTPDQKAKEAADFILKLDESMFNLINGYQEVNYDKGTMEYMYNQMEKLKNEYMQLFKGIQNITFETYSFTYYPDKENLEAAFSLARFSSAKGIMDISSVSGDLLQVEAKSLGKLKEIELLAQSRAGNKDSEKGIFYRIPEDAYVSVKLGGQVLLSSQFTVNQLGIVNSLPASQYGKIELDNNTGGLKHVIVK